MTKKEYTEWAMSQMDKYGIRHPDTYSEREIKEYCPKQETSQLAAGLYYVARRQGEI